jgi:sarcosine oxidase subunit beta
MRLNGIDAEFLTRDEIARWIPNLELLADARFPDSWRHAAAARRDGAPRRGCVGSTRAPPTRAASTSSSRCEVTGIRIENGAVAGVETTQGFIATTEARYRRRRHSGVVAAMAGIELPIESHVLQAMVSDRSSPCSIPSSHRAPCISTSASPTRASSVMGGDLDFYNSYAQRGNLPSVEHVVARASRCSRASDA